MTRVELTIGGMTCDHCVRSVADAIRRNPAVTDADVRVGAASVRFDEKRTTTAAIVDGVKSAGYSVSGFKKIADAASLG